MEGFIEKYYNHLCCYSGIKLLQAIHVYLFIGNCDAGYIRYKNDSEFIQNMEKEIEQVQVMYTKAFSIDAYILQVCRCIAIIWLYQPFVDGNTRTCLLLQDFFLRQKGLALRNESQDDLIALLYDEQDSVEPTAEIIKNKIYKIQIY